MENKELKLLQQLIGMVTDLQHSHLKLLANQQAIPF